MKFKLSKSQWEEMGKKAGWTDQVNKWKEKDSPEKESRKYIAIERINSILGTLSLNEVIEIEKYIAKEFFPRYHGFSAGGAE